MKYHQIDCLKVHLIFMKILGVWPGVKPNRFYVYYSRILIFLFVVLYFLLYTLSFYYLPPRLEIFAEELILYFTVIGVIPKVGAFIFSRDKFQGMLDMLESDVFQSKNDEEAKMIKAAKQNTILYWKVTAGISIVANIANVFTPFITHLIFSIDLQFPVCRYAFIPDSYRPTFLYPAYLYQSLGIICHMFYNVNVDTFLLGVIFLAIVQLDILDMKLRKVADVCKSPDMIRGPIDKAIDDHNALMEINRCIKHYDAICNYCNLLQQAFSEILFVQFSSGSSKICVCLFRFTFPAATEYYVFLLMYIIVMILQTMVPCWFGSQIEEKSSEITFAVYDCDWTPRDHRFKSNLRLLVERAKKPLILKGGKMFLLSLGTFTGIMKSSYSFFTLLRHMQSR